MSVSIKAMICLACLISSQAQGHDEAKPRPVLTPVRVNPALLHSEERRISLAGQWNFRLDPGDLGVKERWFDDLGILTDKIEVPGSWQGQGLGGDAKDTIWAFGFQTRVFRATYLGTGWYGKHFPVPAAWKGSRICVNFGGVHPSAEVWLNGVRLGQNGLPFVPFGFDVTDLVRFDAPNWLTVRVHEQNRILGLAYNWQGNWSGLYRSVELTATGGSFIKELRVHPDVDRQALRVKVRIGGVARSGKPLVLRLSAQAIGDSGGPRCCDVLVNSDVVEHSLDVPSPRLWSPEKPQLYRVDAVLSNGQATSDALSERVGFVKLATKGTHILINGAPYYMRGSGDFLSNPETGCPDTDRQRWHKKLNALREYGYNYVRCQSYVYTPEYLDAADEVGLLVQSEMGMLGGWDGSGRWNTPNWPQPTPEYRDALGKQWSLVVTRDANHPSANIYCMSNELGVGTQYPEIAWQCYRETKMIKPGAFVIWTDGGWNKDLPGDFVNGDLPGTLPTGNFFVNTDCPKPVIQHEYRWWSSFPDVRIMHKYSGAVRPYAAEIAQEAAARRGLSHILPAAAANSQRLQFVEAKTKMEMCRRDNPRLAGICHFNAMDINPSPQGIIDEFYERKFADGPAWLQTNGDTVVLSSLGVGDRVMAAGDVLRCDLFVSDYSHPPLRTPSVRWEVVAGQQTVGNGKISYTHDPYTTCKIGHLSLTMPDISKPAAAMLKVTLREGNRAFTNQWNLWLFPKDAPLPSSVRIYGARQHTWLKELRGVPNISRAQLIAERGNVVLSEQMDNALAEFVRSGGRVILAAGKGLVRPHPPLFGYVKYFFTPPANYQPYDQGQNGTIILDHPALGDFPHEGFADLQFFRLMEESPPLDLDALGLAKSDPVIRVIHRYPVFHPLAYLMECSVGKGGLVLCAMELNPSWPESRYLLAQLCTRAENKDFRPAAQLPAAGFERILRVSEQE
jgi:hypothetical protein